MLPGGGTVKNDKRLNKVNKKPKSYSYINRKRICLRAVKPIVGGEWFAFLGIMFVEGRDLWKVVGNHGEDKPTLSKLPDSACQCGILEKFAPLCLR